MTLTRETAGATLIDVLDRILDKGIVIDAWIRVSLVGVDILTVEARVVIASLETYLDYADSLALRRLVAAPPHLYGPENKSEAAKAGKALAAKTGS